jgi:branched-subunit amino acid aminotransferase/4-amino-4-deoxychorismate lyase
MTGPYFFFNDRFLPIQEAKVSLDDIFVIYGYGVYETLKVRKGVLYFPEMHVERLMHSAKQLMLAHPWQQKQILEGLHTLVKVNQIENANIKILLYGGKTAQDARLYIIQLTPLFPDRKLYSKGAKAILFEGERWMPQAKSLNMLMSALAFNKSQEQGAYDALLVNRNGQITEGTRTNFWYTDNVRLYTPPPHQVLEGVTQLTVIECARLIGLEVVYREFAVDELNSWQGFFLTSTSTKIMPLAQIEDKQLPLSNLVKILMKSYDEWLENWVKSLSK